MPIRERLRSIFWAATIGLLTVCGFALLSIAEVTRSALTLGARLTLDGRANGLPDVTTYIAIYLYVFVLSALAIGLRYVALHRGVRRWNAIALALGCAIIGLSFITAPPSDFFAWLQQRAGFSFDVLTQSLRDSISAYLLLLLAIYGVIHLVRSPSRRSPSGGLDDMPAALR